MRRCCRSRVLDGARCDGGDIAEWSFPRSEFKWSRRHGVFWIGKSQLRTAEYLQLARYHYREALILVDAMYRSLPVTCCPYTYVDNDAELACGWTREFPRKWAAFVRRAPLRLGPSRDAVASGSCFGASLSAHRQPLAEACVTMQGPVENGMSLVSRPTVLLRPSRDCRAATRTGPRSTSWAMSITDKLTVACAWAEEGDTRAGTPMCP
jgi:Acetoacetate decarboxylase (ADC)